MTGPRLVPPVEQPEPEPERLSLPIDTTSIAAESRESWAARVAAAEFDLAEARARDAASRIRPRISR